MYDKHGTILHIESTCNNVGAFRVKRKVEHRDGTVSEQKAPMKKTIYSLYQLFTIMKAANYRYLEFISSFDDHGDGDRHLEVIGRWEFMTLWDAEQRYPQAYGRGYIFRHVKDIQTSETARAN